MLDVTNAFVEALVTGAVTSGRSTPLGLLRCCLVGSRCSDLTFEPKHVHKAWHRTRQVAEWRGPRTRRVTTYVF